MCADCGLCTYYSYLNSQRRRCDIQLSAGRMASRKVLYSYRSSNLDGRNEFTWSKRVSACVGAGISCVRGAASGANLLRCTRPRRRAAGYRTRRRARCSAGSRRSRCYRTGDYLFSSL